MVWKLADMSFRLFRDRFNMEPFLNINRNDLELLRNGKGTEKISLEIKKIIVLCIGLIVPCTFEIIFIPSYMNGTTTNISYLMGILSELILICLMLYHFFK